MARALDIKVGDTVLVKKTAYSYEAQVVAATEDMLKVKQARFIPAIWVDRHLCFKVEL